MLIELGECTFLTIRLTASLPMMGFGGCSQDEAFQGLDDCFQGIVDAPNLTLEKVDLYWMGISFNENDYGGTQQGW